MRAKTINEFNNSINESDKAIEKFFKNRKRINEDNSEPEEDTESVIDASEMSDDDIEKMFNVKGTVDKLQQKYGKIIPSAQERAAVIAKDLGIENDEEEYNND